MKNAISHYFCIADIGFSDNNNTDLYYYSGSFIDDSIKRKKIAELPALTRVEIELKLAEIIRKKPLQFLKYKGLEVGNEAYLGSGYMIDQTGCLLMLYSHNRIELFDIDFSEVKPKNLYQCLTNGQLNTEINKLRSSAVFISAEQYFENSL